MIQPLTTEGIIRSSETLDGNVLNLEKSPLQSSDQPEVLLQIHTSLSTTRYTLSDQNCNMQQLYENSLTFSVLCFIEQMENNFKLIKTPSTQKNNIFAYH